MSIRFQQLLRELLGDWGAFLQLPLYYDALVHFFGGSDRVIQEIPVIRDGHQLRRNGCTSWIPPPPSS